MTKLNPAQVEASHAWLYDIFSLNGVNGGKTSVRPRWYYNYNYSSCQSAAKTIYEAIKFRRLGYQDCVNIDNALDTLSKHSFIPTLASPNARQVRKNAAMLASYIANFCAEKGIYWDDTLTTPQERDEIKKTTIGSALWEYACFVTQDNAAQKTATRTRTSAPKTASSGQAPQNGYKSLGGLSTLVPNLVGAANNKLDLASTASVLYCIEADKLGKNTPCIFVTPVSSSGQAVSLTRATTVNIGSGNGYSDCKLWWDDLNKANYFLNSCLTKFANGKFQNLHIAKARPDANGYFEVSTEFGNAFIKASRLNEEILEWLNVDVEEQLAKEALCEQSSVEETTELDEAKKKTKKKPASSQSKQKKKATTQAYKIKNIDAYSDAFDKYRD